MRTHLAVTGILSGLFAVMHVFIAWQHAESAALAVRALRLLRRAGPAAA